MAAPRGSDFEGSVEIVAESTFEQCRCCFRELIKPRLLPCFHSFCTTCIKDVIDSSVDEVKFLCPLCKTPFSKPDSGTNGFPENFYAHSVDKGRKPCTCLICEKNEAKRKCMDCEEFYCQDCSVAHLKMKATKTHKLTSIQPGDAGGTIYKTPLFCSEHMIEELSFYCTECKLPICYKCNMTAHKLHSCEDIEQKATTMRGNISAEISHIRSTGRREHISKVEANKNSKSKLSSDVKKCRQKILDHVEGIKHQLDDYVREEINKLETGMMHHESLLNDEIREQEIKMTSSELQFFQLSRYSQNAPSLELINMYGAICEVLSSNKQNRPRFDKEIVVSNTVPEVSQDMLAAMCGQAKVRLNLSRQLQLLKKRQIDMPTGVKCNAVCPLTDNDVFYSVFGKGNKSTSVWRVQGDCVEKVFDAQDFVTKIMKDAYGSIYAATGSSLMKWKPGDDSAEQIPLPEAPELFDMTEANELYMLSSSSVIYKYNWNQRQFTKGGSNTDLKYEFDDCEAMTVNKSGNICITHRNDLLVYDKDLCNKGKVAKNGCFFYGIANSEDGLLYAVDNDKNCIYILTEDGLYFQKLSTPKGCSFSGDISIDQSGQFWVGSKGKLLSLKLRKSKE